ncbi:hypothetical protein [Spirillospora sp. NPDC047279]|uniref:hypothetical protein n=1 Tax=Spirillospora sp. NPDC047279 TaxID=3155478 RepID=UPI003404CFCB
MDVSGSTPEAVLGLVVRLPDGQRLSFPDVPRTTRLGDLVSQALQGTEYADWGPQIEVHWTDRRSRTRQRLSFEQRLSETGLRNGSVLQISISWGVAPGGLGGPLALPELAAFIGGMALSGVVGNIAHDSLKATCRSISERWSSQRRTTFRTDEAAELSRAAACLRFDISDPGRLALTTARPVVLRLDATGIRSLKPKRLPALRRSARSWSCTFHLQEAGLPTTLTIVVQANPPDPERTIIYLLD